MDLRFNLRSKWEAPLGAMAAQFKRFEIQPIQSERVKLGKIGDRLILSLHRGLLSRPPLECPYEIHLKSLVLLE